VFARLSFTVPIPDETAMLKFRRLIENNDPSLGGSTPT
jgi:hypothetical protein